MLNDRIVAVIRTAVPAAVGFLLAKLIAFIPPVAGVIAWLDVQLEGAGLAGVTVELVLGSAAAALVVAGWYWLVRRLGDRWPKIEAILLGSAKQPIYIEPAGADL